jgi:hypothetical protein
LNWSLEEISGPTLCSTPHSSRSSGLLIQHILSLSHSLFLSISQYLFIYLSISYTPVYLQYLSLLLILCFSNFFRKNFTLHNHWLNFKHLFRTFCISGGCYVEINQ